MKRTTVFGPARAAAVVSLLWSTASVGGRQTPALPPRLGEYMKTHVKLTPEEQTQLLEGQPVTKLLGADPAREVAVFGAVWVKAPMSRYIAAVKDIEKFEKGNNFLATKRISDPPRLEDFDQLTLSEEDVKDLKTCKAGDCELKLSEASLTRIQKETDWSKLTATADVERAIRKLALEFVNGYLEGGNVSLPNSHQPSDDCRAADSRRCGFEDAVRQPLLLDSH